ncbi:tRNA modification GTPase [Psychromonas algarum]|uniref:tRNA modification GTPase n=1 Tax=Psychromonas algarum TaxID=2555643 RepID=UPI001FB8F429|nr:tRNA modification GTPase [Psychromonas sp. RZ22]
MTVITGCSGHRTTEEAFTTHAESANILFFQIPSTDTKTRALALAPENAKIETMTTTPNDLSSVSGVLNRIIGVDRTTITGTINKD